MEEPHANTLWMEIKRVIGQLERAPYWTQRRDACEELARLARQGIFRIRRAAEDADPDVAHWGRQCRDQLHEVLTSPLADLASQMERELAQEPGTACGTGEPAGREEAQFAASPEELTHWLARLADRLGGEFARREAGGTLTLPVEGDRQQRIYVELTTGEDQTQVLFYSVCGLARPETHAWALEANATFTRGAFGMIKHNDKDVLIMLLRRKLGELPLATLEKKLLYLARKADEAEARLSQTDRH